MGDEGRERIRERQWARARERQVVFALLRTLAGMFPSDHGGHGGRDAAATNGEQSDATLRRAHELRGRLVDYRVTRWSPATLLINPSCSLPHYLSMIHLSIFPPSYPLSLESRLCRCGSRVFSLCISISISLTHFSPDHCPTPTLIPDTSSMATGGKMTHTPWAPTPS
jgi:hypothetical protein